MIKKRLTYLAVKNHAVRAGLTGLALVYLFQVFQLVAERFDPRAKGFLSPPDLWWKTWIFGPLVVALVLAFLVMVICLAYNLGVKLSGAFAGVGGHAVQAGGASVSDSRPGGTPPKRPLPLIIMAVFFMLQFLGVWFIFRDWDYYMRLIETGAMTRFDLFTTLAFPTVAFLGAVALLLRKRMATVFFACYCFPGLGCILAGLSGWAGYLNVPLTFGVLVYSVYLTRKGILK